MKADIMRKKLTDYHFPEDLKEMDEKELNLLSYAIRDFLVESVSKTGGHLASNLGVVELTIGLHRVFHTPEDKIIWDVGHQSYVHKILTGRAEGFSHLRQTGGMSGFPKTCESPHDCYETGHSSTSLSAAAGMACARDLKGEDYHVIAVIGDGSLTGGMAFEALNNIGASKSNVIIILNDNGMSIARNIGGISNHLRKLRTSDSYQETKEKMKQTLTRIPYVGEGIYHGLRGARDRVKYAILEEGVLFEELGFTYLGPVDGHEIRDVIESLEQAKHVHGPVLIHMITEKGKGYRNAETDPDRFHGIGPFDVETGMPLKPSGVTFSKVMGETALRLAETNPAIVAITAAMGSATGLGPFEKAYPDRFFDVGIAEAHAVTFAAGLARGGMHPLVAIYSSFLQRAYDQIVEDVCLQNLPVVFAIDRAGIVGADGETHHGTLDLCYLTSIPNMTVLTPADGNELQAMLEWAFRQNGPVAIRYSRGECGFDASAETPFNGEDIRLKEGKDVDILAVGTRRQVALDAAEILKESGIDAGVLGVRSAKPLSCSVMSGIRLIATVEDGYIYGGAGEHLANFLPEGVRAIHFGWPDRFIEHGSPVDLYRKYGLDSASIAERIRKEIERET